MFIDLEPSPPEFYIAPNRWVENAIHIKYEEYKARHGGQRPVTPESTHGTLPTELRAEWKDHWDVLGILPPGFRSRPMYPLL